MLIFSIHSLIHVNSRNISGQWIKLERKSLSPASAMSKLVLKNPCGRGDPLALLAPSDEDFLVH